MLPKRFPDRDEIAVVRASADALEPGATDEAQRFRVAGRVLGAGRQLVTQVADQLRRRHREPPAGAVPPDRTDQVAVRATATPKSKDTP